jgi:hypothetical protein
LQPRAGHNGIDIAHDRLRLVQHPSVMLEGRNAAERVSRKMRLLLERAERHRSQFVGCALLFERQQGGAHIGAAGDAVNDHA